MQPPVSGARFTLNACLHLVRTRGTLQPLFCVLTPCLWVCVHDCCHFELQSYILRLGNCLLQSGPEMASPASLQLHLLLNEFRCLHLVKARVTPREWRSLLNGIVVMEGAVGSTAPDWAKLAVSCSCLSVDTQDWKLSGKTMPSGKRTGSHREGSSPRVLTHQSHCGLIKGKGVSKGVAQHHDASVSMPICSTWTCS